VACTCEQGNGSSIYIKCREFLDNLNDCQLLNKSDPYNQLFNDLSFSCDKLHTNGRLMS
jgi:hypothetical protein